MQVLRKLLGRFGSLEEWRELGKRFEEVMKHVMGHNRKEKDVDRVVDRLVEGVKDLVTDPEAWVVDSDDEYGEAQDRRLHTIRRRFREMLNVNEYTSLPALQRSVDDLLNQIHTVYLSVKNDRQLHSVISTSIALVDLLTPFNSSPSSNLQKTPIKFGLNANILHDTSTTLFPLILSLIQIIPIPRLTLTSPQVDLLVENLFIEPGRNVNHSSFFPYNFNLTTTSSINIAKTPHPRYLSETFYGGVTKTTSKISVKGITFIAQEVGYILRLKPGSRPAFLSFFNITDKGLASVTVDDKGVDVQLTVDVLINPSFSTFNLNGSSDEPVESSLLKLRHVKVEIHTLKYSLRKCKFSWLIGTWPIRPLLERLLKKFIASQLETAIVDFLQWSNRELAFARERLRGARVANPKSLWAWWKAIKYRIWDAPMEQEPGVRVAIGMSSVGTAGSAARVERNVEGGSGGYKGKAIKRGVFQGEYAPGSLVALWEQGVQKSGEIVGRYGVVNGVGGVNGAENIGERRRLKEGGWRNVIFDKVVV